MKISGRMALDMWREVGGCWVMRMDENHVDSRSENHVWWVTRAGSAGAVGIGPVGGLLARSWATTRPRPSSLRARRERKRAYGEERHADTRHQTPDNQARDARGWMDGWMKSIRYFHYLGMPSGKRSRDGWLSMCAMLCCRTETQQDPAQLPKVRMQPGPRRGSRHWHAGSTDLTGQ